MISSTKRKKRDIQCGLYLMRPKDVVCRDGQLAGILGTGLVDVVSADPPIHRVLANLPDDERAMTSFVSRWGEFITDSEDSLRSPRTIRKAQQLWVGPAAEAVQALAQAHPESGEDYDASNFFLENAPHIVKFRDMLRKAWDREDPGHAQALEVVQQGATQSIASPWAFKDGRIEIRARDAWSAACILFLRDYESGKTYICGNPDCPARYFLKRRKTQRFCEEGTCALFGRRESNREWWKKFGKEQREERRKKAQNRRRKP